jgi:hypothetical protein
VRPVTSDKIAATSPIAAVVSLQPAADGEGTPVGEGDGAVQLELLDPPPTVRVTLGDTGGE